MQSGISKSGLRWCVDERPESLTATIGVWVRAGSRNDPRGAEGLAHLVEHGIFHSPSCEALGPEHDLVDAWTGIDEVAYVATVEGDDAGLATHELLNLVFQPTWDDDALEQECSILEAEMRSPARSPIATVAASALSSLHPGQPFARNMFRRAPMSWPLNSWMARSFHRSFYAPDQAVLVATGAITADQVADAASRVEHESHGALQAPPSLPRVRALPVAHREAIEQADNDSVFVAVGVRSPSRRDPRQTAAVLSAQILGGGPAARLQRDLRGARKLVYDMGAFCLSYNDGGALVAYAATTAEHVDTVVGALHHHVDALHDGSFDDEELELAVRRVRSAAAQAEESSLARIRRLGVSMLHLESVETPADMQRRVSRVSRNSIKAALADADQRTVVVCSGSQSRGSGSSNDHRSVGANGAGLVAARG
ncbi:MAG: pitrilysin family protein [Acidimicrobiia bacterium]